MDKIQGIITVLFFLSMAFVILFNPLQPTQPTEDAENWFNGFWINDIYNTCTYVADGNIFFEGYCYDTIQKPDQALEACITGCKLGVPYGKDESKCFDLCNENLLDEPLRTTAEAESIAEKLEKGMFCFDPDKIPVLIFDEFYYKKVFYSDEPYYATAEPVRIGEVGKIECKEPLMINSKCIKLKPCPEDTKGVACLTTCEKWEKAEIGCMRYGLAEPEPKPEEDDWKEGIFDVNTIPFVTIDSIEPAGIIVPSEIDPIYGFMCPDIKVYVTRTFKEHVPPYGDINVSRLVLDENKVQECFTEFKNPQSQAKELGK